MWLWYVIMGLGLVAMMWCAKNQRRVANAQLYSVICLVVVAVSAVMALSSYFGDGELEQSISNAKQFELAKVDQIAQYVNANYAGKKVAVIIRSDMMKPSDYQINVLEAFTERVKDKVQLQDPMIIQMTDYSQVSSDSQNPPPVLSPEEELNAKKYNQQFDACKNAKVDLVVNFAGLPPMNEEVFKLKIWRWGKNDPKVVLAEINEMNFDARTLKTCVAAAVVSKPDVKFDYLEDKAPEDLNAAFKLRFVLLTEKNATEVLDNKGMVKAGLK